MAITKKVEFRFNGNLLSETGNGSLTYTAYPDITNDCLNLTGITQKNIRTQFTYYGTGEESIGLWSFWFRVNGSYNSLNECLTYYKRDTDSFLKVKRTGENTFSYEDYYHVQSLGELAAGWHQIIITFNGADSSLVYLDGQSVGTQRNSNIWDYPSGIQVLNLGYSYSETSNVNVDIDDFIVASGTLSAQEALDFYRAGCFIKPTRSENSLTHEEFINGHIYALSQSQLETNQVKLIDQNSNDETVIFWKDNENVLDWEIYDSPRIVSELDTESDVRIIYSMISDSHGASEINYTQIGLPLSNPYAEPQASTFSSSVNVTLHSLVYLGIIKYTLDGTEPNPTSLDYQGGILTLSETTILKFKRFELIVDDVSLGRESEVITETYTKTFKNPYAVPSSKEFERSIEVELINENGIGDIYYTLDGTEPTIESNKYFFNLNFFNSKTLKFKIIAETVESEIITETYIKKWEVKNIMSDGRVGQSNGVMTAEVKLYGEADTEYQKIGDVPQESAEQFKSTDAPVIFKNKRTGNNAIFGRNNPGEQHYTVEVEHNAALEAFLSNSIIEVDGKYYGGANAGKACKEFTVRLRPDYMGDNDAQDILIFKAICKTDVEFNSGTDAKCLMKLDFTALSEKIEIEAPDKPVGTLVTTAGTLTAGDYTYVAFAATNDGRIKSTASTAVTVPGTGTNSIEVAFTVPAGADTIKLYRTVGSEIKSRLCTAAEFAAGKITDTGALTWTTETAIPDNTTVKPYFTATHKM